MATIPASEIVSVTPGVLASGGNALDLVDMNLTESTQPPIGTVQSFINAFDVGEYFGFGSPEYASALVYFKGFDGSNVKPGTCNFVQYPGVAVAAYLRGGNFSQTTIAALKAMSGSLTVVMDGYTHTAGSLNFSSANSFSDAAALIQTGLTASEPTEASVTASISTTVMTVTAVGSGTVAVGQTVTGSGVTANTIITALGSGTGGTGTYTVSISQTVGSESLTLVATAPTVVYDSVSGGFVVKSGITGTPSTAAFATGSLKDTLLLTSATGAVLSQGAAAAVPATFMTALTNLTQDWASFMTMFDPDGGSGNTVKLAFAAWTDSTDDRYAYVCWDTDIGPTLTAPDTSSLGYKIAQANNGNGYSGTELIYAPDYIIPSFICGAIASVDFSQADGRIDFAGKTQTGLTATVTDVNVARNLLANGYSFLGAYATANQQFVIYQNNQISGPFLWLDSYVNQIWMNNAFQLALMELYTNVRSIPYNQAGYAKIATALQPKIQDALDFGAIRAGVTLSVDQIAALNSAAGSNIAGTVSSRGWYLQILDATATVRAARGSPPMTFWYTDGQSVQNFDLDSIEIP